MTQKEYTGPEYEIEFARAWLKYVEGGKVGVDPRTQWEGCKPYGIWFCVVDHPPCHADHIYRWKPAPKRMVTIGYMNSKGANEWRTLVSPEVEAPKDGTRVFIIGHEVTAYFWTTGKISADCLDQGRIFLTSEDAQAMADWLATCRKGGQS